MSITPLTFNPVKLILLIGWVYLCLYFVRRVEFSPLVPNRYRPIANIVTLLTGPFLLLVLFMVTVIRESYSSEQGFFSVFGSYARNSLGKVTSLGGSKGRYEIKLVDSAGRSIKEIYGRDKAGKDTRQVLDMTNEIILDALSGRASDILIDPVDTLTHTVRFRVDGILRNVRKIESNIGQAVINSIKAVSNMDISERRRPQDGAFSARTVDGSASFRVASAGVVNGEKLSIRILNKNAANFNLENVGMSQKQQKILRGAISQPSGMILISGPTGSGKTTTLYGILNEVDFYTRNVITVEDPIECVLPNCSQIEVNPKADITFAKSLRSILRQDPDVICVGEIRDEETAAIGLRAAQTGHLVLATIHCETNASALVRLIDLGVSPMLLASGLTMIASQRLLRRLCERCKSKAQLTSSQIDEFRRKKVNYDMIYKANGCKYCDNTGYRDRIGIFDVLVLDKHLKSMILNNKLSIDSLKTNGEKKGKSNLYKQGVKKVVSGYTSLEELKRVLG